MPTSRLQDYTRDCIERTLPEFDMLFNYRPEWLIDKEGHPLELDIYLPDLDLAIEVQGEQHSRYVPFFHVSYEGFKQMKERDLFKKQVCTEVGIILLEVHDQGDVDTIIGGLDIRLDIDGVLARYENEVVRRRSLGRNTIMKLCGRLVRNKERIALFENEKAQASTDDEKREAQRKLSRTRLHGYLIRRKIEVYRKHRSPWDILYHWEQALKSAGKRLCRKDRENLMRAIRERKEG